MKVLIEAVRGVDFPNLKMTNDRAYVAALSAQVRRRLELRRKDKIEIKLVEP